MNNRPPTTRPSLLTGALYVAWTALIVAAPTAAAWIASSLAAHAGGSVRLAAASGLLVFPVLPAAWEAVAAWRRRRAKPTRRFLTRTDRMVLRTLAVALVFIGALLAWGPQRMFVALNNRGDWMLDGRHSPAAETLRRGLFWLAARSEWLYHLTDDNPFHGEGRRPRPRPIPTRDLSRTDDATPVTADVVPVEATPSPPRGAHDWPWPVELHPAVRALPASAETSPASVGMHLARAEPDLWQRARAVHDYVADRVAYDVDAYRSGVYPPQDAETTFRTRRSVCAGYAALFEAIGRAAGLTVETVVGRARGVVSEGMGEGHAWSAVKLDGRWHLVDATWDAGYVSADGFHKRFGTWYFLAPPEVFATKHYPDEARWQLLDATRTPGEFMRTPALEPEFFADGLRLMSPDRDESDARGAVDIVIDNPRRMALLADVAPSGGTRVRCEARGVERVALRCPLHGADLHEVIVFANTRRQGTYWSVATLRVHNR